MAGYIIHSIIGVIIGAIVFFLLQLFKFLPATKVNILLAFLFAVVYSILADIDYKSSLIRRTMRFCLLALVGIYIFLKEGMMAVVLLIVLMLPTVFNHRGFIHSIVAGILFSLPLLFIGWQFCIIGFFCYLSHLVVDGPVKFIAWK